MPGWGAGAMEGVTHLLFTLTHNSSLGNKQGVSIQVRSETFDQIIREELAFDLR